MLETKALYGSNFNSVIFNDIYLIIFISTVTF